MLPQVEHSKIPHHKSLFRCLSLAWTAIAALDAQLTIPASSAFVFRMKPSFENHMLSPLPSQSFCMVRHFAASCHTVLHRYQAQVGEYNRQKNNIRSVLQYHYVQASLHFLLVLWSQNFGYAIMTR